MNSTEEKLDAFRELLEIMDRLRAECPWDRKQTYETLRNLTIEETYELADAILEESQEDIMKELGDLLLHIVFYAKIGSETGAFDIADITRNLNKKLIYRHPHIFGETKVENDDDVKKLYQAVVRGYTEESGVIDYPLQEEKWTEPQPAVTTYRKIAQVELPHPVGRYQTARYSLLEVEPKTGRMHQIRKHMKHIFHPIVGDTTHGDGKHNQLFRDQFDINRLLLVATELEFQHPYTQEKLTIRAEPEPEMACLFEKLGWAGC